MKAYYSIVIFVTLLASSLITCVDSYVRTEAKIEQDLNHALTCMLTEKGGALVTADTIRAYRQLQTAASGSVSMVIEDECFARNLSIPQLRGKSYVSFDVLSPNDRASNDKQFAGISGDTVLFKLQTTAFDNISVALRGHAECSFATIFSLSDQTTSSTLMLIATLWGAYTFIYMRRSAAMSHQLQTLSFARNQTFSTPTNVISVGDMWLNGDENTFYNSSKEPIRLTPMQHKLMTMFFNATGNRLTKDEICTALWPKKDDPSETLYTLIRRLKPIVEANSNLRIEVERGRAYRLIAL